MSVEIKAYCSKLKPIHSVPFEKEDDNQEIKLGSAMKCLAKDCPIFKAGDCTGKVRINVLIKTPKGTFINVFPKQKE